MAEVDPTPEPAPPHVVQELTVRIVESKDYRTIHANGAFGGYNQHGELYLGVYSERAANAESATMQLMSDGSANVKPNRTSETTGIVRELQIGMFMTPMAAQNLVNTLVGALENFKEAVEQANREEAEYQSHE